MSTYHLRLEAVNLDAFVYDTNLLSAVRGGGLLLLRATRDVQSSRRAWAGRSRGPRWRLSTHASMARTIAR
jgi:hypothetical protein